MPFFSDKNICTSSENPCQNGGECVETTDLEGQTPLYACHCRKGFTGTHCEQQVHDCHYHGCGQKGECQVSSVKNNWKPKLGDDEFRHLCTETSHSSTRIDAFLLGIKPRYFSLHLQSSNQRTMTEPAYFYLLSRRTNQNGYYLFNLEFHLHDEPSIVVAGKAFSMRTSAE